MLRISQAGSADQDFTLKLEGRIGGVWVNELRLISDTLLSNGRLLNLDLADVSYADAEGVAVLCHLKLRGAKLLTPTPFLAEQLKTAMESS